MMPGMRGVNPRQMKQAMKRMGISTEDLDGVEEIVIRTKDKEYVFKEASVSIMNVQGQKTFQIVGEPEVRARTGPSSKQEKAAIAAPSVPEEDVAVGHGADRLFPREGPAGIEGHRWPAGRGHHQDHFIVRS